MRETYAEHSSKVVRGPATATFSREFHAGKWVRIAPGYYVATGDWISAGYEGRFLMTVAAVLMKDPRRTLCGETALYVSGVRSATPKEITVVSASVFRNGLRRAAFRVYGEGPDQVLARKLWAPRIRDHQHVDRAEVPPRSEDGVSCVETSHALAEVLVHSDGKIAMAAADAVCAARGVKSLSDDEVLKRLIEAQPHASVRRRAQRLIELSSPDSESVLESFSKWVISCLGFPTPLQQVWMYDAQGEIGRVDFRWPRENVTGEPDGVGKDVDFQRTREERVQRVKYLRQREERLRRVSEVAHWGMDEVEQPELLRDKLLRAGLKQDPKRMLPI